MSGEPLCQDGSLLAASPGVFEIPPAIETTYISEFTEGGLDDLFLAVLAGCWTDYPGGDNDLNLPANFVLKGTDLALGFGTDQNTSTKWYLLEYWISSFWAYSTGNSDIGGVKLTIRESLETAAAEAILVSGLWTEQDKAVFTNAQFHHAIGVSPDDYYWPARYGDAAN